MSCRRADDPARGSESSMITIGMRSRSWRISSTSRPRLAMNSPRERSTAGSATVSSTSWPIAGSSQPSSSLSEKSCRCLPIVDFRSSRSKRTPGGVESATSQVRRRLPGEFSRGGCKAFRDRSPGSDEAKAAVDADHLAGDPRRSWVGECDDPARDVCGLASAAEWDLSAFVLLDCLDVVRG
jgi:hypothetical protein